MRLQPIEERSIVEGRVQTARPWLCHALLVMGFATVSGLPGTRVSAQTQSPTFPTRPVTLVVPYSPGTGVDLAARAIAERLAERWHQPVVVENRVGASGNIGAEAVARAAPTGHVLLVAANTFTITPAFARSLPYDPVADFAPVARLVTAGYALALNPAQPMQDLAGLLARARAEPGRLAYASPGSGTAMHLAMELLKLRLGVDMLHVPYKGMAGAITDVVSGQVPITFLPLGPLLPQASAGRLRLLAVTGPARLAALPGVPTFREQGAAFMDEVDAWYGLLAPARTPPAVIARIHADSVAVLEEPALRVTLARQHLAIDTATPEAFAALIRADLARWARVVSEAHVSAD